MKELSIKEIQLLQLDLMKIVHSVCVANNIPYYLISGSCLGAVRHKGFIPWDDDIDIAMMRKDYDTFIKNFNNWFDTSKYFLQTETTDKDFSLPLARICINGTLLEEKWATHLKFNKSMFMDIFPLDNVPDDENLRKKQEKQIRKLRKIINRKIYSKSNNVIIDTIKLLLSLLLKPIPLSILLKRRLGVMTKYNSYSTECVCSMASKYGYKKHIMSRLIYGDPTLLPFEDANFFFPQKYKDHLERLFGKKYMMIPPVEKREIPTRAFKLD